MAHEIRKVGIVGGGVIGAGWAARFALNGIDVSVYDPDPEIERKTAAVLGVSPALVCRVCNGTRRLTPDFAMRVERASNGRISKAALIWGAAA